MWLLVLITLSGTLAMHMFVPALPAAARDLATSPASMQRTISLDVLGLGVGQLVYGPLSDRYGRRPVLIGGLAVYTLAGLVLGRAIVRDTARSDNAAKRLALVKLMVSAGPGLAPLIGSALSETLGWRSIFAALAAGPFIFTDQLHRSAHEVGVFLTLLVAGVSVGSISVG